MGIVHLNYNIYSLSGSTCTNSADATDGDASPSSMPNTATSSEPQDGITSVSSNVEHSPSSVHSAVLSDGKNGESMPPYISESEFEDGMTIPLDTSTFIEETSSITIGLASSQNSDFSIDNGSGPVYIVIGVVIDIIVLGTILALVAVVLFMKAR